MTKTAYQRDQARRSAKRVFKHYMEVLFDKAGIPVSSDNRVEWDEIIDSIITAAGGEA